MCAKVGSQPLGLLHEICKRIYTHRVFSFLKNSYLFFTVEVGKRSCGCDLQCTVPPEIRFDEVLFGNFDRLPCNVIITLFVFICESDAFCHAGIRVCIGFDVLAV